MRTAVWSLSWAKRSRGTCRRRCAHIEKWSVLPDSIWSGLLLFSSGMCTRRCQGREPKNFFFFFFEKPAFFIIRHFCLLAPCCRPKKTEYIKVNSWIRRTGSWDLMKFMIQLQAQLHCTCWLVWSHILKYLHLYSMWLHSSSSFGKAAESVLFIYNPKWHICLLGVSIYTTYIILYSLTLGKRPLFQTFTPLLLPQQNLIVFADWSINSKWYSINSCGSKGILFWNQLFRNSVELQVAI